MNTIGFGNATITAKTTASEEVSYKVAVSRGEDYLMRWDDMYLDADTVLKRVKAGTLNVLDIRFEKEVVGGVEAGYAAGHIEGSMWAPCMCVKTDSKHTGECAERRSEDQRSGCSDSYCMYGW